MINKNNKLTKTLEIRKTNTLDNQTIDILSIN